jgi:hypothetical protein
MSGAETEQKPCLHNEGRVFCRLVYFASYRYFADNAAMVI